MSSTKIEFNATVSINMELTIDQFVWLYNIVMETDIRSKQTCPTPGPSKSEIQEALYDAKDRLMDFGVIENPVPKAPIYPKIS